MWSIVSLTNNYTYDVGLELAVLKNTVLQPAALPSFSGNRTAAMSIPYLGTVYFKDLGSTPLGPSSKASGVVILFNDLAWVFRYVNDGQLSVTVNADGTLAFSSPSGDDINPVTLTDLAGNMKTWVNQRYVTAMSGGGLDPPNVAIITSSQTIGANELFTLIWIDKPLGKFALRTAGGQYVTAVGGGGIGGSINWPIQTDRTGAGDWELFTFKVQADGRYAIRTFGGNYLTAVNGGGIGIGGNQTPVHTDARTAGPWETFSFIPSV